ncbi:MAG: hemerythrin domain-containing protein [Polyangiaceae bacterium]|jgi:iron-sulfur cluster repair protein YtfE (RIC family)
MQATTLLHQQHRNLQELCDVVEGGSASVRESLLPQLAGDLAAHLAMEEHVFYPAALAALDEHSSLKASQAWHLVARQALERAIDAPVDGEEFAAAIRALHAALAMHADEEEALFPRLERALDPGAMRKLGLSMMAHYDAKQETGFAAEDRYSPMPMRAHPVARP